MDKAVIIFQPVSSSLDIEPSILVDGHKLKVIDKFIYLGSTINKYCTPQDEISVHAKNSADAFTALNVWSKRGLKCSKIAVYNACVVA